MISGYPKWDLAVWVVICFFQVCAPELTVRYSELQLCKENEHLCVTLARDCSPPPPTATLEDLNMSCYYHMSEKSVTCHWRHKTNIYTETVSSLIFSSEDTILSCEGVLNAAAILNVTVKIRNYNTRSEIWSQPHTVLLYNIAKPSQPVLLALNSTVDSLVVSWRSSSDGICRLRYRNNTDAWSQAVSVPAHQGQMLVYIIKHLLPFTVYTAAVACRGQSGSWSHWSSEVTERTLQRAPSRRPVVCYRVEKNTSSGSFHLHLMWKALDLHEAGGQLIGYQVSYEPVKTQKLRKEIHNVTEPELSLVVEEGRCMVTVNAHNMAGLGPATYLSINTHTENTLPSVKHLWVSRSVRAERGLLVQWASSQSAAPSTLPVSHFAIRWRAELNLPSSHWTRVDGATTSVLLREHLEPERSYIISVFPVLSLHCGPPLSLPASLQHGALLEAVRLKVVGKTETTVTAVWTWQRKSTGGSKVDRYDVMLRRGSHRQTVQLWPDQRQHTFLNLTPNTEYSLILLAGNVSMDIIVITTVGEVTAAVTAAPLVVLLVFVTVAVVFYMTLHKSYLVSNPRCSTTGQWLLNTNKQKLAERSTLDIQDFQVTDVLGEKSPIMIGPKPTASSDENLHEDMSLPSFSHLIIKLSALDSETEYVSHHTQHQDVSLQPYYLDYIIKGDDPDDAPLQLCQTHQALACLLQEGNPNGQDRGVHGLRQTGQAVNCDFHEILVSEVSQCFSETEAENMANLPFLRKCVDVETCCGQTDCSSLLCEEDYISNSLFTAKPTDEHIRLYHNVSMTQSPSNYDNHPSKLGWKHHDSPKKSNMVTR
ncbi:interleukin-6 receptor subunit beta [Genypterus blacodes]|uniref:interleukin-6 receptor subunit beta n=1 Tax=Genypterus blacodes TaxID=154954 RepID=UPI003F76E387